MKKDAVCILDDEEIRALNISNEEIIQYVRNAFDLKKKGSKLNKISQTFDEGRCFYNTMPAIMPAIDAAGVKFASRYPSRNPSVQADLLLYRYSDGELLGILDAAWITSQRTAAVAALAVDTFAKTDSQSIAVIGLGQTGSGFLDMFLTKKENVSQHIKLFRYKDHAEKKKEELLNRGAKNVTICNTYEELICDSDVIVSAVTVAESNFGRDEWYKEGTLVVPIHTRGFQNCDLFFDKVFADDTDHVKGFQYFSKFKSFAEFDDVLSARCKGRENNSERILSYNIGIALHDIYLAKMILDKALKQK